MGSHGWNLTVATGTTTWMSQMRQQYFGFRGLDRFEWIGLDREVQTKHRWRLSGHEYICDFRFPDRMMCLIPEQRRRISLSIHVRMYTIKINEANWRISWYMRGARIMTRSRHTSRQIIHRSGIIISHLLRSEVTSLDSDGVSWNHVGSLGLLEFNLAWHDTRDDLEDLLTDRDIKHNDS
jgi:hypothetical protein